MKETIPTQATKGTDDVDQRSYSTSRSVSAGKGDRVCVQLHPPMSTQPGHPSVGRSNDE